LKPDAVFKENLRQAEAVERLLYTLLSPLNHELRPKKPVVDEGGAVIGFQDDGDMTFVGRVECKQRRLKFTSAADFPFKTVLIDEVYKLRQPHVTEGMWEQFTWAEQLAHIKWFHSYWIVSSDMRYAAVIKPSTKCHWKMRTVTDSTEGRQCVNYECPVEHCQWVSLTPQGVRQALCQ
jgi:hypothetical protein